jgi:hypothetical protein
MLLRGDSADELGEKWACETRRGNRCFVMLVKGRAACGDGDVSRAALAVSGVGDPGGLCRLVSTGRGGSSVVVAG